MSPVKPMKATTAPMPRGPGWVYELKWDGMRAVILLRDGTLRLWSANGHEVSASYPELTALGAELAHLDTILDGEIVALDETGVPSFERLQHRMHITDRVDAARRAVDVPAALMLFDILRIGEQSTTSLPFNDRRRLLDKVGEDLPTGIQVVPIFPDGDVLLEVARSRHMEGIVAKREDALYSEGRRTRDWIKVKLQRRQELVIGGWAEGQGERAGRFGSLLVGYREEAGAPMLHYAGRVGTGFSQETLATLQALLVPLAAADECPFDPPPPRERSRDAHWVRPELVAEVSFGNWTEEGIMRHPVYLGLRQDVDPADVIREP